VRHIILLSVSYPAVLYFPTLSHKQHDFFWGGGEVIRYKMCFEFLYNFVQKSFGSENHSARYYHKCEKVFCKVPLFLSNFTEKLEFS